MPTPSRPEGAFRILAGGVSPRVRIQKQANPGGATDCNEVRILCRPSRARFKTGTYQGLAPLAGLLPPSRGLHDASGFTGRYYYFNGERETL